MSKENPNFTIITSGGCSASCDFCTDSYSQKAAPNYVANLARVLLSSGTDGLPENFKECSISGGEPTTSPDLANILTLVTASKRFRKVVFTTNGHKLVENQSLIAQHINHLNISRHAIGHKENAAIFKLEPKHVITDEKIQIVTEFFNKKGIDVNLNYVYTKNNVPTKEFVFDYVAYAKKLGANSVTFRYDQNENTLESTTFERLFDDYTIISQGGCPVCRNHSIFVRGMPVVFKASFAEPSQTINDLYELIYHVNGTLCLDWEGKMTYQNFLNEQRTNKRKNIIARNVAAARKAVSTGPVEISSGGGCGNSGGGCGSSSSSGGGCGSSRGGGCGSGGGCG